MKKCSKSQATLDRFVVRSPKVSPASSPTKTQGYLRQATLESLKGVVVVEEMERARVVLERTDVSTELKVDTLQHLLCKTPAKEVLIKTKLGKTVHKLCHAKEAEVAAAAQQVYTAWKKYILSKVNRPYIEMKSDLKTQKLRQSARQMLFEALQRETEEKRSGEVGGDHKIIRGQVEADDCKSNRDSNKLLERKETEQNTHKPKQKQEKKKDKGNNNGSPTHKRPREDCDAEGEGKKSEGAKDHKKTRKDSGVDAQHDSVEMLAEHLEKKVYQNSQRRVDNGYRRTIRSLVFTLRHQRDIRKAVILATLSVEDFVKQNKKS